MYFAPTEMLPPTTSTFDFTVTAEPVVLGTSREGRGIFVAATAFIQRYDATGTGVIIVEQVQTGS